MKYPNSRNEWLPLNKSLRRSTTMASHCVTMRTSHRGSQRPVMWVGSLAKVSTHMYSHDCIKSRRTSWIRSEMLSRKCKSSGERRWRVLRGSLQVVSSIGQVSVGWCLHVKSLRTRVPSDIPRMSTHHHDIDPKSLR